MPDTQSTTSTPETISQESYNDVQDSRSTGILTIVNMGVDAIQGYVVIPDE